MSSGSDSHKRIVICRKPKKANNKPRSIRFLMKQLSLIKNEKNKFYGGQLVIGKRKGRRPLSRKAPIHLVLKAKKSMNLFRHQPVIQQKILFYSKKFGIKSYGLSVQRDHIHFHMRITNRNLYRKFIRALTGILARIFGQGLWQCLPFTRVAHWGKDFRGIRRYLHKNDLEILGLIPYQPRHHGYEKHLAPG